MENMERHPVPQTARIRVTEELLLTVQPKRVLEIGAGDHSFKGVYRGRQGVEWITADLAPPCDIQIDLNRPEVSIPLDAESVDLVLATEFLEHLLWPHALLKECRRLLDTGGRLLISVPNAVSLSYRLAWLFGKLPSCAACGNLPPPLGETSYVLDSGDTIAGHVIDFNLTRLKGLLDFCGFEPLAILANGIYWHRQILPAWMLPASFSSNLIVLAGRRTERAGQ